MSYTFHPDYAIDCSSFIDDPNDIEMWQVDNSSHFGNLQSKISCFIFYIIDC